MKFWACSAPEGKRFVMIEEPKTATSTAHQPVRPNVGVKWMDELKRRVPAK